MREPVTVRIHGVSASPFVRKVRAFLAEKAIDYELESVMPWEVGESFLRISPLGKIPVYQDGDFTLPDSSAICGLLERQVPEPALYPEDAREYGRALWIEEYADTKLVQTITPVFSQRVLQARLLKRPSDEALVERHLTQLIPPVFDHLEHETSSAAGDWLAGGSFGIADISVASVFVNLHHAGEEVDAAHWPALCAYLRRVHARPCFAKLIAEEEAAFAAL